jgi:hypothetical protein
VEVFAAGLYQFSACDGVDARELALIQEFLSDVGAEDLADRLPSLPFDPATAYDVLETSWLRSLFLRSALVMIMIDGDISDIERDTFDWIAGLFGVQGGIEGMIETLQQESL